MAETANLFSSGGGQGENEESSQRRQESEPRGDCMGEEFDWILEASSYGTRNDHCPKRQFLILSVIIGSYA